MEGEGITVTVGVVIGDGEMPAFLPALAYAGIIGMSALDLYSWYHTTKMTKEFNDDKQRFFDDYFENTGIEALYPYYQGSYVDYVGSALTASEGVVNLYKKYRR